MIHARIRDIDLTFKTSSELFSPRNIDKGTLAMLSFIDFEPDDKVLDLGCGYGVVGILAAKLIGVDNVIMVDIDESAVQTAIDNAILNDLPEMKISVSDGFQEVKETGFTKIISHPPYHVDFSVPKRFIEKGFNRLAIGGKLFMVTKRREWYMNKLKAIFGSVRLWEVDGYYVFMATKKSDTYANSKQKKRQEQKDNVQTGKKNRRSPKRK